MTKKLELPIQKAFTAATANAFKFFDFLRVLCSPANELSQVRDRLDSRLGHRSYWQLLQFGAQDAHTMGCLDSDANLVRRYRDHRYHDVLT